MDEKRNKLRMSGVTSFNIGMIFLLRVEPFLRSLQHVLNFDEMVHDLHFGTICFQADGYSEWAEAIFQIKSLSSNEHLSYEEVVKILFVQKDDVYEEKREGYIAYTEIFSIVIVFCDIFNQQCGKRLQYLVEYFKAMQQTPEKFPEQWKLWDAVIEDVLKERKYICSPFFWSWRITLPFFYEYTAEENKMLFELVSKKENKVGTAGAPNYVRDVYLETLSNQNQLWCYIDKRAQYAGKRHIIIGGLIDPKLKWSFKWFSEPEHENGGLLSPFIPNYQGDS